MTLRIAEQLAHACGQRDLLGFARRDEAQIEGANHRVAARRHECAHIERGPHGGAATPDAPSGHAGYHCRRRTARRPRARRCGGGSAGPAPGFAQQGPTHNGPHAGHRPEEVLLRAPDGTLLDHVVEVPVDRAELAFGHRMWVADPTSHRRRRVLQPIPFGAQHPDELPTPREQASSRPTLIGKRPRRRADALGKSASRSASMPSDFASCPVARAKSRTWRGFATSTGSCTAASGQRPPVRTHPSKHDERGHQVLETRTEASYTSLIVRHRPPVAAGTNGHNQLGFRDVNANHGSWGRHPCPSSGRP